MTGASLFLYRYWKEGSERKSMENSESGKYVIERCSEKNLVSAIEDGGYFRNPFKGWEDRTLWDVIKWISSSRITKQSGK